MQTPYDILPTVLNLRQQVNDPNATTTTNGPNNSGGNCDINTETYDNLVKVITKRTGLSIAVSLNTPQGKIQNENNLILGKLISEQIKQLG